MTNKYMLMITTVLMLISINAAQAQIVNYNMANDTGDNRYTVHGNGTVTDTGTGLMWQQCSIGQTDIDCSGSASTHHWSSALQLASTANTGSYSDWRLPNMEELRSLLAYDRQNPSINEIIFPNTAALYYWSSSPGYTNAWRVGFYSGGTSLINRDSKNSIRLVRSGY